LPSFDKEDRFFEKEDRNAVSTNHSETAQIAASGFRKHSEETGPSPDRSCYLAVSMSRDATVKHGTGAIFFHVEVP